MANFPGQWSPNTNLTGNSQFIVDASGFIWVISNLPTGAGVFKSTDNGVTFTLQVTIPSLSETTVAFDPAITIDSNGVLHFIGQANSSDGIDLLKYSYNPTTATLIGPTTVLSGSIIGSDYDILALSTGSTFVVGSILNNQTETLYGVMINSSGVVTSTVTIAATGIFTGNRLGSVSLYTPNGQNIEIYLGSHPKLVTFQDFTLTLELINVSSGGTYAAPIVLGTFQVRHTDDRLTVLANGQARYLSQCVYYQQGSQLVGVILLGYLANSSSSWSFTQVSGTPTASLVEPTLSLNSSGLLCAYITKDLTKPQPVDGAISLFDLNPTTWTFIPRADFHSGNSATFLRGTKQVFSSTLLWGFIGQTSTGTATYYTGFNAPPVAILQPTSIAAIRGVTYEISAALSYDPNQDTIEFSWALTDTTDTGILTVNGSTATILVPDSIGPAAHTMTVTVNVTDYDESGNPIHSPTTANITVNIAAVAVPTIGNLTTNASRNSEFTLAPAITSDQNATLSYDWMQVSGTPLAVVGLSNGPTLTASTSGANLAGETVTFELFVSDGVNSSVHNTFNVVVPANTNLGPTNYLARSVWSGNISQRNSSGTWPLPSTSSIFSNFSIVKRGCLLSGVNFITFIGSKQVLTLGDDQVPLQVLLRSVFVPGTSETVVDAIHTETDYTVVLTSDNNLIQYLGTRPSLSTDAPDVEIALAGLTSMTFTQMFCTPTIGDVRVFAFIGPNGCFLLQIENSTFSVQHYIEIDLTSRLVYEAQNIQWIRFHNIESLGSGQLLIGAVDANGNTFETLLDIPTRNILQTWSASTLRNTTVTTGEVLFQPESSYSGLPLPPVVNTPLYEGSAITLTWTQERPDLVVNYNVRYAANGGPYIVLGTTRPGSQQFTVSLPGGNTYAFQVQAVGLDGNSAWSNSV